MEWVVASVLGLGAIWFVILALMGAGKKDNLKGFRLKLLVMCLFWPITFVVLTIVLVVKALRPRKKSQTPPLAERAKVVWRLV